jgi:uncharacterized protein HemY
MGFPPEIIDEAQSLLREQLSQHEDEGVRLLAELVKTPDDHPSIAPLETRLAVVIMKA